MRAANEFLADAATLILFVDGQVRKVRGEGKIGEAPCHPDEAICDSCCEDYARILKHSLNRNDIIHGPALGQRRAIEDVDKLFDSQIGFDSIRYYRFHSALVFVRFAPMNLLVTAGNTQTPIDDVRCITNIFSGRTGGRIALEAYNRGHTVTIATSHPQILAELAAGNHFEPSRWQVRPYKTYDDLHNILMALVPGNHFDAIVQSAAISDYTVVGRFVPDATGQPTIDATRGKMKSSHPELWLKLIPAAKLIDRIRTDWNFTGTLVKFKLEVSVGTQELLEVAEASRRHSSADLMVANTLEGMSHVAYLGGDNLPYVTVTREELATKLLEEIEKRKHR